jgi:hypothetical protein
MGEIERLAGFYEGSWVGQFRANSPHQAKLFAQAVATAMEDLGVNDVGYVVREGSGAEFSDDEARISIGESVPHSVVHDSVPHEEVRRQLKEAQSGNDDDQS